MDFGLPPGFSARASRRDYGELLTVFFLGREDHVCLKLYAAVDQGGGRHLADLLALEPKDSELLTAARWTMTHDPPPAFMSSLKELLRGIGHGNVAHQL